MGARVTLGLGHELDGCLSTWDSLLHPALTSASSGHWLAAQESVRRLGGRILFIGGMWGRVEGLRCSGIPRPPSKRSPWSCCSGHSAGRGWHPPRCPPLQAGWGQAVDEGGCLPSFLPSPHPVRHSGSWGNASRAPVDSPANLPSGMESSMFLALWGSLQ